jgi:hypothetical protein
LGDPLETVLDRVRQELCLDAETEHDVLEEIRTHLEESSAAARARGVPQDQALAEAATRFCVRDVGSQLQATHAGWGAAEGVIAAGLPVICALALRWLVFTPEGAIGGWHQALVRPAFWAVSLAALLVPLLALPRWRHALAAWGFFWILSLASMLGSAPGW